MTNRWKKINHKILHSEFFKFLIVGAFSAGVNFFGRILFRSFFSYTVSILVGYLLGTISSYLLNKNFTFKAFDEKPYIQFVKFLVVTPFSILLGVWIAPISVRTLSSLKLIDIPMSWLESVGHLMAISITTIYNFLVIKFFCFRKIIIKKREL